MPFSLAAALLSLSLLPYPVSDSPPAMDWPALQRYEAMNVPPDNPMSAEKVELGRRLFFDRRVSGDGSVACVSCHQPERGLTDPRPRSIGAYGIESDRACPTLWNVGYQNALFWEGSASTLEKAIGGIWSYILAPPGPGRAGPAEVAARLNAIPGYRSRFVATFGEDATVRNVPRALAAFLRTLVANRSAWVRFQDGESRALTPQARRGWSLFDGKAGCTQCHNGLLLTDQQFHNVGIGMAAEKPDLGRWDMTKNERDRGAFKTPTLLNVGRSAPYFHDGSAATLAEAVDLMLRGGIENAHRDPALKRVELTRSEREDLLRFLSELTADLDAAPPDLPR